MLTDCDPAARVPSCPDWDAADLLWHLTTVHHFWHHVVTHRPAAPPEDAEPARPASYDDLLALHVATTERLLAALDAADPAETAWTWSEEQTVGFIHRRQAHEALIHRLDAGLTAGATTPLPAALATDGVDEVLGVIYGGLPEWGRFAPEDLYVEYRASDTGTSVWTRLGTFSGTTPDGVERAGEPDQHVVPAPGRAADVVVSGSAGQARRLAVAPRGRQRHHGGGRPGRVGTSAGRARPGRRLSQPRSLGPAAVLAGEPDHAEERTHEEQEEHDGGDEDEQGGTHG
nr:maleylpyruvate isomerase N-terminal domain-containing protein [Nocardioides convexus]